MINRKLPDDYQLPSHVVRTVGGTEEPIVPGGQRWNYDPVLSIRPLEHWAAQVTTAVRHGRVQGIPTLCRKRLRVESDVVGPPTRHLEPNHIPRANGYSGRYESVDISIRVHLEPDYVSGLGAGGLCRMDGQQPGERQRKALCAPSVRSVNCE